jgi:hypothetical protein
MVISSVISSNSAKKAASAQTSAANQGIDEQRREFDVMQSILAPYTAGGLAAMDQQGRLLGLAGDDAQREAIQGIERSPGFMESIQQGENAMLQNASATGGLRGGNIQAALSQFRPQMLNQAIQARVQNLGQLSSLGANAASGVGNAAMQMGGNIAKLYGNIGSAQAGSAVAQGQSQTNLIGQLTGMMGMGGGF